jgi:hypothetical protein
LNYGWKLCEKKEEMMLDEKIGKVVKGERKKKENEKKRIEKKSVPLCS